MVKFEKCVTSIFTLIALLLLNVTNVSADSGSQSFKFSYVKGAPTSESCIDNFSLPAYIGGIDVRVFKLTQGAQLIVSSSNLNPNRTVIDKVGTYHISLSQIPTGSSVTVSIRLIPNERIPVVSANGYIYRIKSYL